MKKIILILTASVLLLCCTGNTIRFGSSGIRPVTTVLLLELNKGVSEQQLAEACNLLEENFPRLKIVKGGKVQLPSSCYNGKRYRADSILRYLDQIKPDSVTKVIGITSSDISNTRTLVKNGKKVTYPDYGILGLGRRPGTVCVVSNHRMGGNAETFSKTVLHEFMHTLGVRHCTHEKCIMQDGNGSGKNMRESTHVHKECLAIAMEGLD